MAQIFISYRRFDSTAITGRIYDRLRQEFGKDAIFKDVDNIPAGRDFRGVLREATANCGVMLVIIGPGWVNAKDVDGNRRLDDPADFVRLEVETGLQRDDVLVVPLIVSGGTPPRASEVPESLKELAYNNALFVRDDPDFHRDVDRLIEQLAKHVSKSSPDTTAPNPVITHEPLRNPAIIAAIIGAVAVIIGAIITVGPQIFKQEPVSPTSMAQGSTSSAVPATPSETPTSTGTPDLMAAAEELIKQQTAQASVAAATGTADYFTQEASNQQVAIANQTATATRWTQTPTPDNTQTVIAILTEFWQGTATENSRNATATATRDTAKAGAGMIVEIVCPKMTRGICAPYCDTASEIGFSLQVCITPSKARIHIRRPITYISLQSGYERVIIDAPRDSPKDWRCLLLLLPLKSTNSA